jgi:hypothetical protein
VLPDGERFRVLGFGNGAANADPKRAGLGPGPRQRSALLRAERWQWHRHGRVGEQRGRLQVRGVHGGHHLGADGGRDDLGGCASQAKAKRTAACCRAVSIPHRA